MVAGVLKDQKHFKLESQRSLEAAATEKQHRRSVMCRRVAIITILVVVVGFIVVVLGGILYTKVMAEHSEQKAEDKLYPRTTDTSKGGVRGGGGTSGPVYGIALATLRDLQKMHGGSLSTLRSLRAVAFELDGVPQLKSINRIERSGETYTLHFDKGTGEQLSFTSTTFVYIDGKGKTHILTSDNRRRR